MRLTVWLSVWLGACDGGDAADRAAPVEPPEAPSPTFDAVADDPPGPSEPTPEPARAYPAGPYGTGYLEVTRDLEFFEPWTGATPRLADYYLDPDVSLLLVPFDERFRGAAGETAPSSAPTADNRDPTLTVPARKGIAIIRAPEQGEAYRVRNLAELKRARCTYRRT